MIRLIVGPPLLGKVRGLGFSKGFGLAVSGSGYGVQARGNPLEHQEAIPSP